MVVELWQVAVFIVAICALILTIYFIGVLQGLNKTMEQIRSLVYANSQNIHSITNELVEVSKNATIISEDLAKDMEEINQAVESLNNTTQMVEETVQMGKDNVILPLMGLVNLGQGIKSAAGILHKKDKEKK